MTEELNPYEQRLLALRHAERELLKLKISAFLWSIPLAIVLLIASFSLINWLNP